MKKYSLLIIILFYLGNCLAQDTTKKRNRLTETVTETYFVLKSDKQTKRGLYQAVYRHDVPLASGRYVDNKKAGVWHFYDTNGKLVENFDYDHSRLLYEEPSDSLTQASIVYGFDNTFKSTDHVTKPIKPGGRSYGYLPYIQFFKLSDDFRGTDFSQFIAILELLVSPGGRLADFKVHIKSDDFERITTFSTDLVAEEDKQFIPASLNGEPILSRIFVKMRLTDFGELDVNHVKFSYSNNNNTIRIEN